MIYIIDVYKGTQYLGRLDDVYFTDRKDADAIAEMYNAALRTWHYVVVELRLRKITA